MLEINGAPIPPQPPSSTPNRKVSSKHAVGPGSSKNVHAPPPVKTSDSSPLPDISSVTSGFGRRSVISGPSQEAQFQFPLPQDPVALFDFLQSHPRDWDIEDVLNEFSETCSLLAEDYDQMIQNPNQLSRYQFKDDYINFHKKFNQFPDVLMSFFLNALTIAQYSYEFVPWKTTPPKADIEEFLTAEGTFKPGIRVGFHFTSEQNLQLIQDQGMQAGPRARLGSAVSHSTTPWNPPYSGQSSQESLDLSTETVHALVISLFSDGKELVPRNEDQTSSHLVSQNPESQVLPIAGILFQKATVDHYGIPDQITLNFETFTRVDSPKHVSERSYYVEISPSTYSPKTHVIHYFDSHKQTVTLEQIPFEFNNQGLENNLHRVLSKTILPS